MTLRLGNTLIAGSGANQDLSNLTSHGKNIANWSSNVTNCITKIPQDIKLELNNGTLTLKSGSKVYVPNGVGVFKEIIVSDNSNTQSLWGPYKYFVVFKENQRIEFIEVGSITSGSTQPEIVNSSWWYDTTNNKLKKCNGTSWFETNCSLPIALISTTDGSTVSSIDQVFNGFGYIGSTFFALPGVKGLIPSGRNPDGSLKNIEFTTTSVKIYTSPTNYTFSNFGWVWQIGNIAPYDLTKYEYREDENYNYELYNNVVTPSTILAYGSVNAGVITLFQPKLPFHAVDRNDSSWLSGLGMPSSRYIDLTLGASGASYTAPANGCFAIWTGLASANYEYVALFAQGDNVGDCYASEGISPQGYQSPATIYVKKGTIVYARYNGTPVMFRFYYSEGENV